MDQWGAGCRDESAVVMGGINDDSEIDLASSEHLAGFQQQVS
jgi:hypothetical protein